ncbi:MAG: hypothetical protein WC211_09515 [Dehalococcoidia bacterium]
MEIGFHGLTVLEEALTGIEASIVMRLDEVENRLRRTWPTMMPEPPDEYFESLALRDHERIARWGIYLAAFSDFERSVLSLAGSGRSATEGMRLLGPTVETHIADWADMYQRVHSLQGLRNELAHGGGTLRPQNKRKLLRLIHSGEINPADSDYFAWRGEKVIVLTAGAVQGMVRDLRQVHRVLLRFSKPPTVDSAPPAR